MDGAKTFSVAFHNEQPETKGRTNMDTMTNDTNTAPVNGTAAPVTAPVTLRDIFAESRTVLQKNTKSMTKLVLAKTGENATTDMKREARAEIKIRLADKLAPEKIMVELHRDGKGGYEVVEAIDTVHGERILTGTLRLTDRKTLAASALSRLLKLIRRA